MATKVWKGALQFGLLSIPIYLNVGARDDRIDFKSLHDKCHTPLNKPYFCSHCNEKVDSKNTVKGYETGGKYVILTNDEINSMAPASEKVMEITDCVLAEDVDPLYLAESFYMLPEDAGRKPYSLLAKALEATGRVALAKLTKSNRENLVLIRPKGNGLMLHFLWYASEVAEVPEFDNLNAAPLSQGEIKMGAQLVESLSSAFQPKTFTNEFQERVTQLIASKMDESVTPPPPVQFTQSSTTVDLMEALRASLAVNKKKPEVKPTPIPATKPAKKKKAAA